MTFVLRGLAAVPLIALVNGLALGSTIFLFEQSTFAWQAFWMTLWFTAIIALVVGMLLLGPALVIGQYLPQPKLGWLVLIGGVMGPLPILFLGARGFVISTLVTFVALGVLSALLWWTLVERHRPPAINVKSR